MISKVRNARDVLVKLIRESYFVRVFSRAAEVFCRRTSIVIMALLVYSFIAAGFQLAKGALFYALAIGVRFLFLSAALVFFSEETFWKEAKKGSVVCAFFSWLAR